MAGMFIGLPDGVRLWVEVNGLEYVPDGQAMRRRPTVIALHGGPGTDSSGMKVNLAGLEQVAQVIYVDQRGNGRSDDGDRARWTLAQWGDDVVDLCAAVGLSRPVVMGGSWGGMVAMSYATRPAEHPAALVLTSTSPTEPAPETMVEAVRRLGGDAVAEVVRADLAHSTAQTSAAFVAQTLPVMGRRPGTEEYMRAAIGRTVRRLDVGRGRAPASDLTSPSCSRLRPCSASGDGPETPLS